MTNVVPLAPRRGADRSVRDRVIDVIDALLDGPSIEAGIVDALDLRRDLGADSLDMIELGVGLESTFGIDIADADLDSLQTVRDVVGLVERLVRAKEAAGG